MKSKGDPILDVQAVCAEKPRTEAELIAAVRILVIGCFEVTKVSEGKWKCKNTFTTFEHTTYGTEEEVREQLERQSNQWKARVQPVGPIRPPQRGSAWRNKPPIEPKKKPEDR